MAKKKLHLRLTIDVEYDKKDEDELDLRDRLDLIPAFVAGEGMLTGDGNAEVVSWSHKVTKVKES